MRVLSKLVNGFHVLSLLVATRAITAPELSSSESLWLFAAAWGIGTLHELGHVWGARAVGYPVYRWWSMPGYGKTTTAQLDHEMRSLAVALGGPVMGFTAAAAVGLAARQLGLSPVASRWFEWLAVAGMIDNMLNLLPIWRLDGAVALRILRGMHFRRRVRRVTHIDVERARVWRRSAPPCVTTRPLLEVPAPPRPVLSPGPARVYRMRCPRREVAPQLRAVPHDAG